MKYYNRSMTKMKVKNRKIVILSMFWKLNIYFLKTKIQFYVRSKLIHFYKPIVVCLNLLVTLHCLSFKILTPQIVTYQMIYTRQIGKKLIQHTNQNRS